jgi:DNA repair exonuclease SbcCD nuclease subunit
MTIIRSELIVFDKSELRSVSLKSRDGDTYNLHGVGHEFDKVDKNLILNYPISKKDGSYDIGIAHCFVESVASSSEYDRYLPTSYEDLKSRQYDYFALGHIHLPSIYKDSNIAYSGSLQALNFKEEGPRGGNYIEIDKYGTSIRHINLTTKTYQSVNVSLSNNLKDHLELMKVIRDEVDKKLSNYNFKNTLVRLIFSGSVSKEIIDLLDNDKKYLSEQISLNLGCDYIEIDIEDVKLNYNSENILSKDHFLGYSLEKFDYDINEVKDKLLKELSFSGVDMKNIDIDKKVNEVRDMILESLLKR